MASKAWKDCTYAEQVEWLALARNGKWPKWAQPTAKQRLADLNARRAKLGKKGTTKRHQLPGGAVTQGGVRYAALYMADKIISGDPFSGDGGSR